VCCTKYATGIYNYKTYNIQNLRKVLSLMFNIKLPAIEMHTNKNHCFLVLDTLKNSISSFFNLLVLGANVKKMQIKCTCRDISYGKHLI
jgi:hypothetical protein